MDDLTYKKLSEVLNNVNSKDFKKRAESLLNSLNSTSKQDIAKKLASTDKNVLLSKINELDPSIFQKMNIDKEELKRKLMNANPMEIALFINLYGDEILKKIKETLKQL